MYSVANQKSRRLNWLQRNLPEGLLVDARWLERNGYSRALRSQYAKSGWLDPVMRGVYRRPVASLSSSKRPDVLRWQHVIISLQMLHDHFVAAGGRTALELQGFGHYLPAAGTREVHLYGNPKPPNWVFRLPMQTRFFFHNSARLFARGGRTGGRGFPKENDSVSTTGLLRESWGHWDWPLVVSSPERAILELLEEVPGRETFHQADVVMEGLRTLSPRRLRSLLLDCRSIKVKRLFFWFADRHAHPWLHRLDRTGINLGSGKRMLVRGGRLDARYGITVPERLDGGR